MGVAGEGVAKMMVFGGTPKTSDFGYPGYPKTVVLGENPPKIINFEPSQGWKIEFLAPEPPKPLPGAKKPPKFDKNP